MSFPRAPRGGSPRPVIASGSREKTKPTEGPWVEFMRVAILGVGGLGRTLASELRTEPRVSSLLLIDEFGERARVLTGIRGRVAIEATQLNVENRIALAKALAGADVVVNTTLRSTTCRSCKPRSRPIRITWTPPRRVRGSRAARWGSSNSWRWATRF